MFRFPTAFVGSSEFMKCHDKALEFLFLLFAFLSRFFVKDWPEDRIPSTPKYCADLETLLGSRSSCWSQTCFADWIAELLMKGHKSQRGYGVIQGLHWNSDEFEFEVAQIIGILYSSLYWGSQVISLLSEYSLATSCANVVAEHSSKGSFTLDSRSFFSPRSQLGFLKQNESNGENTCSQLWCSNSNSYSYGHLLVITGYKWD